MPNDKQMTRFKWSLTASLLGERTHNVHCFQTQLTENCLVVWFWVDRDSSVISFSIKNSLNFQTRFSSGLIVFTFYSKIFLSWVHGAVHVRVHACTSNFLRCTIMCANVIRCTKKRVPRFLILEALSNKKYMPTSPFDYQHMKTMKFKPEKNSIY